MVLLVDTIYIVVYRHRMKIEITVHLKVNLDIFENKIRYFSYMRN